MHYAATGKPFKLTLQVEPVHMMAAVGGMCAASQTMPHLFIAPKRLGGGGGGGLAFLCHNYKTFQQNSCSCPRVRMGWYGCPNLPGFDQCSLCMSMAFAVLLDIDHIDHDLSAHGDVQSEPVLPKWS